MINAVDAMLARMGAYIIALEGTLAKMANDHTTALAVKDGRIKELTEALDAANDELVGKMSAPDPDDL
jgi:LPS O-antigen subunit length determinant protein (WzzB/FepE family)